MAGITSLGLLAIHQAVCDTITAPTGARCYPTFVDNPETPCLMVVGDSNNWVELTHAFSRGLVMVNVTVLALASAADARQGQEQIMSWLSIGTDDSILDALYGNPTLGGVVAPAGSTPLRFGSVRFASSVEWPVGSNTRYAVAELDLSLSISS